MTGLVIHRRGVVINMSRFSQNLIGSVINSPGFVVNMTELVLNMA